MQNGSLRGPREDPLPNAIQEDSGRTALHEAASTGDDKSLQVLLAAGADRNVKDSKHGNTPLHEAAWRGYSRCVKALCALPQPKIGKDSKLKGVIQETRGALHSALLGTRNVGGFSALHLAAQNGHNQSCREILLAGGDPDVQNNYGDTPLHTACRYGHAGATRILLSAKCDPNRTNLNGDTPLHISCAMGRRKLTRILLEAGSNLEIKNAQNETPRDIALRKNLPEILEILDSPIVVKPQKERERSSSNSKSAGADKTDGQKSKSSKRSDYVANPANWSPYGCHYFPDPRSFPSPKLETLPKEPLAKGEQYYLDLAGNIRKGPIGVGNTCYCGPFFRHIEERISRNRKSIRKYVHKATERLDNKVQALALKTDDQIEQLTKSMIVDRIRCEGRRLHLEQWLKRGDPARVTVGHHLKSKKNQDNTNTLTRCKSLEILDDTSLDDKKIQNSRSFDILDEADVIVHHHDDSSHSNQTANQANDQRKPSSQISSDRKTSKNSERSRSSGSRLESETYSVSERLEELLAKTNEILEMEKMSWTKKKQILENAYLSPPVENVKKRVKPPKELKVNQHSRHSMYTEDIIQQLKKSSLSDSKRFPKDVNNVEFIEKEMKKITSSLLHQEEFEEDDGRIVDNLPPLSPEIIKEFPSQKEIERRSDQEHEKSSILSGSSQKNPSSSGSGYVPDFNHPRSVSMKKSLSVDNQQQQSSPTNRVKYHHKDYRYIIDALRNDYQSIKRCDRDLLQSQQIGLPLNGDEYRQDYVDSRQSNANPVVVNGFYQNTNFEDAASSSNNTLKSDKHRNLSLSEKSNPDQEETVELSELANVKEINELKSRILNGSNWKSQVLKKTQQQLNKKSDTKEVKSINGIVQKFEIKNSEIKTLKNPTSGILRRSKVQELVAKIQGEDKNDEMNNVASSPDTAGGNNGEGDSNENQNTHHLENEHNNENSESSEDEYEHHERRIYANKPPIENHYQLQQQQQQQQLSTQQQNYVPGEDHYYYNSISNRAQAQVPSPQPYHHQQSNLITNNQRLAELQKQLHQKPIIDARNLIPKDAYFHELPNKNRMRPIVDKLPEKQMINFSYQFQSQQQHTPSPPIANFNQQQPSPNSLVSARTRNPLPYIQSSYDVPSTLGHENYVHVPTSSSPSAAINNPNLIVNSILNTRNAPYPEKLLSNRKYILNTNSNDVRNLTDHSNQISPHNHQHQIIIHSPSPSSQMMLTQNIQSISITPEQAQIDRDMNNDSGYSTKIGGSSHGPSPSLSGTGSIGTNGTDFGTGIVVNPNTNIPVPVVLNHNGNELANVQKGSVKQHAESNGGLPTYFVGNIGASSLV